jgi:hypothetical protein
VPFAVQLLQNETLGLFLTVQNTSGPLTEIPLPMSFVIMNLSGKNAFLFVTDDL